MLTDHRLTLLNKAESGPGYHSTTLMGRVGKLADDAKSIVGAELTQILEYYSGL